MTSSDPFRVAVFTNVYNENAFLPIWLSYYGQQLGPANLFVIDDGSTDGSTDRLEPAQILKLPKSVNDEDVRARMVSFFHRELLRHYDAAIYTDVDEFLVVDPLLKMTLPQYIQGHTPEHANAIGFEVIHNHHAEPEYDPAHSLFSQRSFAIFRRDYCKQLIHRVPVKWRAGFHFTNCKPFFPVGLYLFHTRALDYETSRARIRGRNKLQHTDNSFAKGYSVQNRMDEQAYLSMIYVDDPLQFQQSVPDAQFNSYVMAIAKQLDRTPMEDAAEVLAFSRHLARMPARFRDSIPAATLWTQMTDQVASVQPAERALVSIDTAYARAQDEMKIHR